MSSTAREACRRCALASGHPLAQLDEAGVCGPCRRAESPDQVQARREKMLARMEASFAELRRRPGVHALVAFSGGKDSSWTLLQLRRRYGLRLRALTLDNGFLSAHALDNARRVAEAAEAEHVVVRPQPRLMRELFAGVLRREPFSRTSLTRASGVCNACIAVVKSVCLRETLTQRVPVMAWGWSPGQAPTNSAWITLTPEALRANVQALREPVLDIVGPDAASWFPELTGHQGPAPVLASPLALLDYDEERVLEDLAGVGWRRPSDVDPNSSNCRLNTLGNHVHRRRHGFHPYALEMAGLVRGGVLAPLEATRRLEAEADPTILREVARELGLPDALRAEFALPGGES